MSDDLHHAVIATARALVERRLCVAQSGNVSARETDGFLITPTGVDSEFLTPSDLVHLTLNGEPEGHNAPSSEWHFHAAIYQARPEVRAVVHTHSTFATSLACLRRPIPPFHYMVAKAGGRDIRCAPYATYGTRELSEHVLAGLENRRATLLSNHGVVTVGEDLLSALRLAEEVEELAHQYCNACRLGEPVLLTREQMDETLKKFESYGQ